VAKTGRFRRGRPGKTMTTAVVRDRSDGSVITTTSVAVVVKIFVPSGVFFVDSIRSVRGTHGVQLQGSLLEVGRGGNVRVARAAVG